jgi:hypothetical protein
MHGIATRVVAHRLINYSRRGFMRALFLIASIFAGSSGVGLAATDCDLTVQDSCLFSSPSAVYQIETQPGSSIRISGPAGVLAEIAAGFRQLLHAVPTSTGGPSSAALPFGFHDYSAICYDATLPNGVTSISMTTPEGTSWSSVIKKTLGESVVLTLQEGLCP